MHPEHLPHLTDADHYVEYLDVMTDRNRTVEVATFYWQVDDVLGGRTELALQEDYVKYTGDAAHDGSVVTRAYWYVWDPQCAGWTDQRYFERGDKVVLLRRDALVALRRRQQEENYVECRACGEKIHCDKLAASNGVHLGCGGSDGERQQEAQEARVGD